VTPPRVLTVAQVADYLQVHPRTVLNRIASGQLAAKNIGSERTHGARWRIRQVDADRYLDARPSSAPR